MGIFQLFISAARFLNTTSNKSADHYTFFTEKSLNLTIK